MPIRDINPSDRSIRNIPVSANRRPPRQYEEEAAYDSDVPMHNQPPKLKLPRRRSRVWVWGVVFFVACAGAGLLLSTVFENAKIVVAAKTAVIDGPQTIVAQPNASAGVLGYQTITLTKNASTTVASNGTQQVSRPATGVVTIYNAYSTAPQQLVASTRLTTANGVIYRIKDNVTVPGGTKKTDGTLSPGSITVSVYADKPGAASNTTASIQLSILGFKGDSRYTKFVVQSQGPMTGGFIGTEPAAAPADLTAAQSALKQQLGEALRSSAVTQIPEGFVIANGSYGMTYTNISQTAGANNTLLLSQGATATLVIVRESDLAVAVAKQAVTEYHNEPISFSKETPPKLSLPSSISTTGPLALTLEGTSTLVWQLDPVAVKTALLGKKKADFKTLIGPYTAALTCDKTTPCTASIRPFWTSTFPSDPEKVDIEVVE